MTLLSLSDALLVFNANKQENVCQRPFKKIVPDALGSEGIANIHLVAETASTNDVNLLP